RRTSRKKAQRKSRSRNSVCASKSSRGSDSIVEEFMARRYRRTEMENWKRGLIAGSAGLSLVFLLKGSRTGALIFGGAALATLASEYPEKFAEIRKKDRKSVV